MEENKEIIVEPEDKQFESNYRILEILEAAENLWASADLLRICSEKDIEQAADLKKGLTNFKNEIETIRKEKVKPIKEVAKRIDFLAGTYQKPFETAIQTIKNKVKQYNYKLEEAIRKEEEKKAKRIEKAVEAGRPIPIIPQVQQQPKTIKSDSGNKITGTDDWTYRIINKQEIIEYLVFENKMDIIEFKHVGLKAIAKINKLNNKIPGIEIYNDKRY